MRQATSGSHASDRNDKRGLLLNLILAKQGEVPPELNVRCRSPNRTARHVNASPPKLSAAPCLRFELASEFFWWTFTHHARNQGSLSGVCRLRDGNATHTRAAAVGSSRAPPMGVQSIPRGCLDAGSSFTLSSTAGLLKLITRANTTAT
jgi:hypothetical protein